MNYIVGSPEWFFEKAKEPNHLAFQTKMEKVRFQFLSQFSPDCLQNMSGEELLDKVFDNKPSSMVRLLMFDDVIRDFGAAGKYPYLGVLYKIQDGTWRFKEHTSSEILDRNSAVKKAEKIRDQLLFCINTIEKIQPSALEDYWAIQDMVSPIFYSQYAWVIKYFQMVFPYFFPGMYADKIVVRALKTLGLPSTSNRIVNVGILSLFIRKCDVNNLVFNRVYSDEWGWLNPCPPCPNANNNFAEIQSISHDINKAYYSLPDSREKLREECKKIAIDMENKFDSLKLEGKEKEAFVHIRVNQSVFRDKLIERYGKCCLCGVSDTRLLVASHIKPWASCEPIERLDPDNGFLLCPNHDKLFDQGLISFDETGKILISDELQEADRIFVNVNKNMSISLTSYNKKYLTFHRNHIFKNIKKS